MSGPLSSLSTACALVAGTTMALVATPANAGTVHQELPPYCEVEEGYRLCSSYSSHYNFVRRDAVYVFTDHFTLSMTLTALDGSYTRSESFAGSMTVVVSRGNEVNRDKYYSITATNGVTCTIQSRHVYSAGETRVDVIIKSVECG